MRDCTIRTTNVLTAVGGWVLLLGLQASGACDDDFLPVTERLAGHTSGQRQVGVIGKDFWKIFFRESVLSQFKEIGEETGCVGTGEKDEEIRQHQNLLNHFGME